jgi:hypothetical protein
MRARLCLDKRDGRVKPGHDVPWNRVALDERGCSSALDGLDQ